MVENLRQGDCEDATDFMIRVGSSVGNLAKDWKGQITEAELKVPPIRSLLKWSQGGDLARSRLRDSQAWPVDPTPNVRGSIEIRNLRCPQQTPRGEKCQPSRWSSEDCGPDFWL